MAKYELGFENTPFGSAKGMIIQQLLQVGKDNDITFSEDFIAALLANAHHEAAFHTFNRNPNDNGKPSIGLFQHRADRNENLKKYLAENMGVSESRIQNMFLGLEKPTLEEYVQATRLTLQFALVEEPQAKKLQPVFNSSSTGDLVEAFARFEVYEGYNDPNSEAYTNRKNTTLNYQLGKERNFIVENITKFSGGQTIGQKIDEALTDAPATFEYKFFNNESQVNDGYENGILTEDATNQILRNVFGDVVRKFASQTGLKKDISEYTQEEREEFIKSSFDNDVVRNVIAESMSQKLDLFFQNRFGQDIDTKTFKYQALKKKMLSQLSSQIAARTGSSSSAETFLKDVLRVSDPDSAFYNLPLEDFTDSFLEDYLEKSSAVIEGGLLNQSQVYSLGLSENQNVQEGYLELFKNSYTEEQINAIQRISGKSIEEIFRGEVSKETFGGIELYKAPDFGNLVLHFDRLIDADTKYNYLKEKGVEGLPLPGKFSDEQVQLILDQYNNFEEKNPEVIRNDKLEKQNIQQPYWLAPGFDESTLSDDAKEKLYLDRDDVHAVVRNGQEIAAFENAEQKEQFLINEAAEKANAVNEQNNSNNEVSSDPDKNKKGFWDSLGDVGDKLAKGLGLVKKITDALGGPGTLVSAALGRQAYHDAMKEIKPLELPGVSNMFKQHLHQVQQLSKMGFSPAEAQKHRKDIDSAYKRGIENAVRGTAGDRAKFLANSGLLDSQRASALLDFAATDAEIQRQNLSQYGQALQFHEDYNYRKAAQERSDDLQEQIRNKQGASNFAQLAFQQITDNLNDQSSIYENMFYNKLQNQINQNTNNPLVGLNFPGSGTEAGQIGD